MNHDALDACDFLKVVWVAILSYIANVKAMNLNISEGGSPKSGHSVLPFVVSL